MLSCLNIGNSSIKYTTYYFHDNCKKVKEFVENIFRTSYTCIKCLSEFCFLIIKNPFKYMGSKFISLPELAIRIMLYTKRKIFNQEIESSQIMIFQKNYYVIPNRLDASLPEDRKKCSMFLEATQFFTATHTSNEQWLPPDWKFYTGPLPQGFNNGIYYDHDSGLKIAVIFNPLRSRLIAPEIKIVFGAIGSGVPEIRHSVESQNLSEDKTRKEILRLDKKITQKNLADAAWNILGKVPDIYHQAYKICTQIRQHINPQSTITCIGQCFGASLAHYVVLKSGEGNSIGINPLSLGVGLQWEITRQNLDKANLTACNISAEADPISDLPWIFQLIDILLNSVGIRTCGNYGKHYTVPVPKAYTHSYFEGIHKLIMCSLACYLNPNIRPLPIKGEEKNHKQEVIEFQRQLKQIAENNSSGYIQTS